MTAEASAPFRDNGTEIEDFADEFLVVCPACGRCAKVIALNRGAHPMQLFADRRLLCTACGLQRDTPVRGIAYRSGVDWYFHLPLWLSASCCGEELWALNYRHLLWIEQYVRAKVREKDLSALHWHSRSAVNRLPRWVKSRANRDDVLRVIAKLKLKAA